MLQSLVNERRYRTEYNSKEWEIIEPYTPESGGYIVLHKSQRKKNEANDNIKTAKVLLQLTASAIELGEAKSNQSSIDSTLNAVP